MTKSRARSMRAKRSLFMRPQHRNRRLAAIAIAAVALFGGVALLATALESYRQFFYEPSAVVAEDFVAGSDLIRVGGLVVPGSVIRSDGLKTDFQVVDFENPENPALSVSYTGILPDLFKEDSGVVLTGRLVGGRVEATEVLAKHDENYTPKL